MSSLCSSLGVGMELMKLGCIILGDDSVGNGIIIGAGGLNVGVGCTGMKFVSCNNEFNENG